MGIKLENFTIALANSGWSNDCTKSSYLINRCDFSALPEHKLYCLLFLQSLAQLFVEIRSFASTVGFFV